MNKKHSISSLLVMLYVLYIIYFMQTISISNKLGIFNEDSQVTENIQISDFSVSQVLFYYLFLVLICFAVINEYRHLNIYEDENKINIVNKKVLKYKIFVVVNLLFSIYLIINKLSMELLNSCILMNISSVFICYGKLAYFKSYICNRQIEWLKNTSRIDIDEHVDTKLWRYKVWFNGRQKVSFKYRLNKIITSGFVLFISIIAFCIVALRKSFMCIFFLYFIINHLLIIIEAIFGLYTSTNGKCTAIVEKRKRRRSDGVKILGFPTKLYIF